MPVIYAELWLLHCQPALESNQSSITRILSVSIQPTGSAMGCILIHKGGAPKHLLLFLMKRAPGSGSLKYPFVFFFYFFKLVNHQLEVFIITAIQIHHFHKPYALFRHFCVANVCIWYFLLRFQYFI